MNTPCISLQVQLRCLLAALLITAAPLVARSQLVADGQTSVLDGVTTNVAGNMTIGTNGSFTLLVVTNGSSVTGGSVSIGMNPPASNNRLMVSAGSVWDNPGNFYVGNGGSFNELDVVGASTVTNVYGYIGGNSPSSSNIVWVSDSGSLWQSIYVYLGQSSGTNNQLIITNGGKVVSSLGVLGTGGGRGNSAIVTGAGSIWTNAGNLSIGDYSPNSLFIVTNGGMVFSGTLSGLGMLGASSVSNLAIVTDAGSAWTIAGSFYVGEFSSRNELDILNSGKVADTTGLIGQNSNATNNLVVVSGTGSVWTNSNIYVGNNGPRNMLIVTNGGQVFSLGSTVVGNSSTSSNNSVLISGAGSVWNSGYFYLGYISPGGNRLTINNGGTLISSSTFDLGVYCNSNLLTLADTGSSLQCQLLRVGYSSTGNQCIVSNGATLAALSGQPATIEGTFTRVTITGAGTFWTNAADLDFGQSSNVLTIAGGGTVVDNNGYIENGLGGKPNTAIVTGANSLWKNLGDFHVTDSGAQLLITNGGTLSDTYGYFGDASSGFAESNSITWVSGPGSLWTNRSDFYIGYNGPGNQVFVTDSGTLKAQTLYAGYNGNQNQMIVSNSGIAIIRNLVIGNAANSQSNSVILSGGTITVTNGSMSLFQYGTLTLNSGLLATPFLGTDVASKIILNGGTLQSGATTYRNPAPFAVGDGTDAATFEMLSATSPNQGTHTFPGGLVVSNHALVKGFGAIAANVAVNSGGTIAPGTTNIGTIVVNGNLTLNPGSTTLMKLNALSGAADSLTGATNLIYGGTLQLTNVSGSLSAGKSFTLFAATNYLGAFNNLTPAQPGAGLRWDTNELTIDGVLRVFSTTTPAPALANITMANGNLTLSATGGIPFDPCYLLTSTNLTDWSYMATNYFDTSGAASFTNTVPPVEPQRYFRLQVN